jgi:hypothetical protein
MAMKSEKSGGLTLTRNGLQDLQEEKPKSYQDLGLCVTLVVLLAWALVVSVRAVNWPAIGHAFSSLLAWII